MSKETATITMSAPVLVRLREIASKEKRTLSAQLELMVEKHFAATETPAAKPARKGRAA